MLRHRRRNSHGAPIVTPVPTKPPPCATVARTAGGGAFRNTLEKLLIAEIVHHLDPSFFKEHSHNTTTTTTPLTSSASNTLTNLHQTQETREVQHGGSADSTSTTRTTTKSSSGESASGESASGESAGGATSTSTRVAVPRTTLGAETPGGDEQILPPIAAYQKAIVESMLAAAGVVASRLPPLPSINITSNSNTHSSITGSSNDSATTTAALNPNAQISVTTGKLHNTLGGVRATQNPLQQQKERPDGVSSSEASSSSSSSPAVETGQRTQAVRQRAARYAHMLRKVVTGEYLLGESDELASDEERSSDTAQHATAQQTTVAAAAAAEAKVRDAGSELLLAVTLEAFTDLARYPRCAATH